MQGNGSAAAQVGELHGFPLNLGNAGCAANVGRGQANHCQYGGKQLGAPLGLFVSQALKEKIWKGEFVQLGALLVVEEPAYSEVPMSFVQVDGQVCLKPMQAKGQQIVSIDQWTSAFFVFMTIYLERHPSRAVELIKYVDLIRKLATRFGGKGWLNYDRDFRMGQARNTMRS